MKAENATHDVLFEEAMFPVCSPALLTARGQPRTAADVHDWPLLYHLGWSTDWAYWFAAQGVSPPDLSRASGFRLCSMLTHAVVASMGVAIGRPTAIECEVRQGLLVLVFDRDNEARTQCLLITPATARRNPDV